MRRPAILLALCLLVAQAHGETPSVESLDTLMTLTRADQLADTLMPIMDQSMQQAMAEMARGRTLSSSQREAIQDALKAP